MLFRSEKEDAKAMKKCKMMTLLLMVALMLASCQKQEKELLAPVIIKKMEFFLPMYRENQDEYTVFDKNNEDITEKFIEQTSEMVANEKWEDFFYYQKENTGFTRKISYEEGENENEMTLCYEDFRTTECPVPDVGNYNVV